MKTTLSPNSPAVEIADLTFRYGERRAVDGLNLEIATGEIFVLLGPNGGGKTTLFRLLSTLIPLQTGRVSLLGHDLRTQAAAIRQELGVVFQAPSLDRKLTVAENIRYQAALYGLSGATLSRRLDELLDIFSLRDRAHDYVEKLSGGLRRRVELAKGLIHRPRLLLLDEPSTGLDPGARSDVWQFLRRIRAEEQLTILLTTHLLEEAEGADRIGILNLGKLVALDTPDALRSAVGGDSITIETKQPQVLAEGIRQKFSLATQLLDDTVRLEVRDGHTWIARIVEEFPGQIDSVRLGKPTLEDVFIARTGHRFWNQRREA